MDNARGCCLIPEAEVRIIAVLIKAYARPESNQPIETCWIYEGVMKTRDCGWCTKSNKSEGMIDYFQAE